MEARKLVSFVLVSSFVREAIRQQLKQQQQPIHLFSFVMPFPLYCSVQLLQAHTAGSVSMFPSSICHYIIFVFLHTPILQHGYCSAISHLQLVLWLAVSLSVPPGMIIASVKAGHHFCFIALCHFKICWCSALARGGAEYQVYVYRPTSFRESHRIE